jgi:DNA-binding LytR/AlgR family response regulator
MLHIAICDDEQKYLHDVERLIAEYDGEHELGGISAATFSHPFDLSKAVESGKHYDIFLLDIYMPGMTGIALAQELRQREISDPIIFLTTSRDHALEAFGVGATQYLLKPFEKDALFAALWSIQEGSVGGRLF